MDTGKKGEIVCNAGATIVTSNMQIGCHKISSLISAN